MAKEKPITNAQLKKSLQGLSQADLISLITDISQTCPKAKEFLTIRFTSENPSEVLEKYKQKVRDQFFPKRGYGKLKLREAKKAISDFKTICKDKTMIIDITLYFVENCVEFIGEYGDISENFIIAATDLYEQVVKLINAGGESLYLKFSDRLISAAENSGDGYGLRDDLMSLYSEINWVENDDDDE